MSTSTLPKPRPNQAQDRKQQQHGILEVPRPEPQRGREPHELDPTYGSQIGSEPYDDPTQGRKLGSDPYDDPTRGRL